MPYNFKCLLSYRKYLDNVNEAVDIYKDVIGEPQKFEKYFYKPFIEWVERAKLKEKQNANKKQTTNIMSFGKAEEDITEKQEIFFCWAEKNLINDKFCEKDVK